MFLYLMYNSVLFLTKKRIDTLINLTFRGKYAHSTVAHRSVRNWGVSEIGATYPNIHTKPCAQRTHQKTCILTLFLK